MSEIKDKSELHILNQDGDYLLHTHVEQDISQIKKDNHRAAETSNGFSDGRTMRKTASMGLVEYLQALKLGYALDCEDPQLLQKELHRYLKERGQMMGTQTVKHILTPGGNANIIIR